MTEHPADPTEGATILGYSEPPDPNAQPGGKPVVPDLPTPEPMPEPEPEPAPPEPEPAPPLTGDGVYRPPEDTDAVEQS